MVSMLLIILMDSHISLCIAFLFSLLIKRHVSITQLIAIKDNLCRDWGTSTSPYIICVNLATKLLDQKNKK